MCAKCSTQYRPEEVPQDGFCVARPMVSKATETQFASGLKTTVKLLEPTKESIPCDGKLYEVKCPVCMDKKKVYIKDPQDGLGGEAEMNCPRGCNNS